MKPILLKQLYEFVDMSYSTETSSLKELKQRLLLELKGHQDGKITIAEVTYTKNDFLVLLDELSTEEGKRKADITNAFPDFSFLANLQNISQPLQYDPETLAKHPEWEKFRDQNMPHYFQGWFSMSRRKLAQLDFNSLSILCSYLPLFPELEQYQYREYIIKQITDMTRSYNRHYYGANFGLMISYYDVLLTVAPDNEAFLKQQFFGMFHVFQLKSDPIELTRFFNLQSQLNHSVEIHTLIQSRQEELDDFFKSPFMPIQSTRSEKEKKSNPVYIAVAVIIAFLFLFIASGACKPTPKAPSYDIDSLRENQPPPPINLSY